jgi:hypothetical protein
MKVIKAYLPTFFYGMAFGMVTVALLMPLLVR